MVKRAHSQLLITFLSCTFIIIIIIIIIIIASSSSSSSIELFLVPASAPRLVYLQGKAQTSKIVLLETEHLLALFRSEPIYIKPILFTNN